MYKKFSQLSVVIGLFFSIISVILFIDVFMSRLEVNSITLYTAIAFLIFGLAMMLIKYNKTEQ